MGTEPMTAGEWLDLAARDLREAGVEDPRRDAVLLLAHATGADKGHILAHPEQILREEERSRADEFLRRRASREPLQYILGVQEFWGLPVRVGPGCLIPRPETEHLVEATLSVLKGRRAPAVAEVGTGSGCVLMALGAQRPDARLVGVERDIGALEWSRTNLAGMPRLILCRGDLEGASPLRDLDALVSNPPYIADEEWGELQAEVRDFEPQEALRCGSEPLAPYRALTLWAARSLKPGGFLLCELGVAQARRASALRRLHPALEWKGGIRDLAGRLRVGVWQRR